MVKTILFTKNPVISNSFEDVVNFAEDTNTYYKCLVNSDSRLYNVQPGTHILTTKGNNLFVIEVSMRENVFDFAKFTSITTPVVVEDYFN